MNQEPTFNVETSLPRRSFLKFMITVTAGILASCLPNINLTEAIPTNSPPQIPNNPNAPQNTAFPPPTQPSLGAPQNTEVPSPTQISNPPAYAPQNTGTPPPTQISKTLPDYSCGPANGNTYIITGLCLRDRGCIEVCPVEAIVPGFPINQWPSVYIDQNTCIECGACVPECPYMAIFPAEEVPSNYIAKGGEYINRPGLTGHYEGINSRGKMVVLDSVYQLERGQIVDLTQDNGCNDAFFASGPGYSARDQDTGM